MKPYKTILLSLLILPLPLLLGSCEKEEEIKHPMGIGVVGRI